MTSKGKGAKGGAGGTELYEGVVSSTKDTYEAAIKASTEAAAKAFNMSKDRVEAVVKSYDDVATFGKDNVEAIMAAGNAATKGVEALNAEFLAFSKSAMEDSIAAAKAAMGAKTLQDLIELQTDFAKTSFDSYLQQSSKFGEMAARVAQDTFQPINARVQAAVEKLVKPIAA